MPLRAPLPRASGPPPTLAAVAGLFFTLLVVYMLINWLPLLLVGGGFRASQAAGVIFSLQIGAASAARCCWGR